MKKKKKKKLNKNRFFIALVANILSQVLCHTPYVILSHNRANERTNHESKSNSMILHSQFALNFFGPLWQCNTIFDVKCILSFQPYFESVIQWNWFRILFSHCDHFLLFLGFSSLSLRKHSANSLRIGLFIWFFVRANINIVHIVYNFSIVYVYSIW